MDRSWQLLRTALTRSQSQPFHLSQGLQKFCASLCCCLRAPPSGVYEDAQQQHAFFSHRFPTTQPGTPIPTWTQLDSLTPNPYVSTLHSPPLPGTGTESLEESHCREWDSLGPAVAWDVLSGIGYGVRLRKGSPHYLSLLIRGGKGALLGHLKRPLPFLGESLKGKL